MTDGAPALALGVDPAEPEVMTQPPRPPGELVITGRMWFDIIFAGVVIGVGTLFVLDASVLNRKRRRKPRQLIAEVSRIALLLFGLTNRAKSAEAGVGRDAVFDSGGGATSASLYFLIPYTIACFIGFPRYRVLGHMD